MSSLLARVAQWAVGIVYSFGYFGIAFAVLAGNLHLPLPTGLILPLAGYLIWQGRLSFIPVLLAATVGAVAGGIILYLLGRWFGEERLRRLIGKVERFKIVSTSHLDTADAMFERHGTKAILIGHLIPGVGNYISIPAGVTRMPFWRQFMIYTVIGSLPYNVAHIVFGWALGPEWRQVEQYASNIKYAIPVAVVVGILWYLLRRLERGVEVNVYGVGGWESRRHERRGETHLGDGQESRDDGRVVGTQVTPFATMELPPARRASRRFFCRMITPERVIYDGEADLVIARIADGYIGILANHISIASMLEPGEVRIRQDGDRHVFAASGGFFKVSENLVQILVEEAVPSNEIDVDEAENRIEEAQNELSGVSPDERDEEAQRRRDEIERRISVGENLVRVARKYAEG